MAEAAERNERHGRGAAVQLRNLTVRADRRLLLDRASARFEPGEISLIIGCSGVGKSLLLRVVAGLIGAAHPQVHVSGSVEIDGRETSSNHRSRPAVGVVFQNFALFDELSPADNVRFAQAHRSRRGDRRPSPTPESLLEELGVPQDVATAALSGGQRQRLAIARTLAYDPQVILYDEPTSGLDAATARQVAALIERTHATHPKTSIIVTHDYEALAPIADRIYLLDPDTCSLRRIGRQDWWKLSQQSKPSAAPGPAAAPSGLRLSGWAGWAGSKIGDFFVATAGVAEQAALAPLRLLPIWKSPPWGLRTCVHYLRLVAGPSAWLYIAIAGAIVGFVTTYFTFRFLPYAKYTEPLLIEELLHSMGFALYRILVPVLAAVLIAARCGAAVSSDVGGKSYGQQLDALHTFGIRPRRYLLTAILYAFLIGAPLLTAIGYWAASITSLAVFTATHPEQGPQFWRLHFHRELVVPGQFFYRGSHWLLAKMLACAVGIALIAYHQGAQPKDSSRDVSLGITATILWSTLYVLLVHFAFAFYEFE